MIKYLSPSSLAAWRNNEEEFYLKYLAPGKIPRFPQTQPMAAGSAFDAYIKVYIDTKLFGKREDGINFTKLFEAQVEVQNREEAMKTGAVCYTAYKKSGARDRLMAELMASPVPPRMEFTSISTAAGGGVDEHGNPMSTVTYTDKVKFLLEKDGIDLSNPVVLLGKPDLHFKTVNGTDVVPDFKVNGYYTPSGKGPTPGYICLLDGFEPTSKKHGNCHRDSIPAYEGDFEYSLHPNIEQQDESWATQLSTYSWLAGCPVGSDIIVGIDQLCCMPSFPTPNITVAIHRCTVTEAFQVKVYKNYQELWNRIHSDWFFRDRSREASIERCQVLDKQAGVYSDESPHSKWLKSLRGG